MTKMIKLYWHIINTQEAFNESGVLDLLEDTIVHWSDILHCILYANWFKHFNVNFGTKTQSDLYSIFKTGDSLTSHHGSQFRTKDRDNSMSCAATFKGGWWYKTCHDSNLNGQYLNGSHQSFADGINWKAWHGYYYSLKATEMKIRRLWNICSIYS